MAMGTFGAFTQARLAIYAAQTGITVTGNNISNINTEGYTRQRLNQTSLYTAGSDRYYAEGDVRTGQGALVKSISQIRNPYLDIRYREENAKVGFYDARLEGLNSIQRVLDEVGLGDASKGEDGFGILGLDFMKLHEALQNITDQTGQQEYDDSVRAIAEKVADRLHTYAAQLEQVREDTVVDFKQDIDEVNNILDAIRNMNEEIRKCEIHGDPALELRDARNVQLDKLSGLIDIDVTYGEEEIAAGVKVEKLEVRLGNANPDKSVKTDEELLIDGVFSAHLILGKPAMNDGADKADNRYLDKDGNPTDDIRQAKILTDDAENPDSNYDMMITELKNKNGDLNYRLEEKTAVEFDGTLPKDATWNIHTNKASVTKTDEPDKGDKTIEIYTRTPVPGHKDQYTYTMQVHKQIISKPVALDDNDLGGELQAERELLTEKGVFIDGDTVANIDENALTKRGIGYYQKALDLLANQFAKAMNEANQGFLVNDQTGEYIMEDPDNPGKSKPLEIDGEALNRDWGENSTGLRGSILAAVGLDAKLVDERELADAGFTSKEVINAYLKGQKYDSDLKTFTPENKEDTVDADGKTVPGWKHNANKDAIFIGTPLFSNANNSDDVTKITASNINVSMTWSHTSSLVRSFSCIPGTTEVASGQSDNLVHLKYVVGDGSFKFTPNQLASSPKASDKPLFTGTFYQMWNDIGGTLGQDQSEAGTMLDTYYQSALSIDTDRDSVSTVDFNDEAMNLMMYAKSYNAACRLMTTIDTVLDKLINNTGMTT